VNAAAATQAPVRQVQCPLCGGRFAGKESCPDGCPLAGGCRTLCCPYCHYRFIVDSTVASFLSRVFNRRRACANAVFS
jgi:hypothetical protein